MEFVSPFTDGQTLLMGNDTHPLSTAEVSLFEDSLDDEFHSKVLKASTHFALPSKSHPASPFGSPGSCLNDSLDELEQEDEGKKRDTPPAETHIESSTATLLTLSDHNKSKAEGASLTVTHSSPELGQCVPSISLEDSMEAGGEEGEVPDTLSHVISPALHAMGSTSPAAAMAANMMDELFPASVAMDDGQHTIPCTDIQEEHATLPPMSDAACVSVDGDGKKTANKAPNTLPLDKMAKMSGATKLVPSFGSKKKKGIFVPPTAKGPLPPKSTTVKSTPGSHPVATVEEGERSSKAADKIGDSAPSEAPSHPPSPAPSAERLIGQEKKVNNKKGSDEGTESSKVAKAKTGKKFQGDKKKADQEAKRMAKEEEAWERELMRLEKAQKKIEKEVEREEKRLKQERKKAEREQKKKEKDLNKLQKRDHQDESCNSNGDRSRTSQTGELVSCPKAKLTDLPDHEDTADTMPQEQPSSSQPTSVTPPLLSDPLTEKAEPMDVLEATSTVLSKKEEKSIQDTPQEDLNQESNTELCSTEATEKILTSPKAPCLPEGSPSSPSSNKARPSAAQSRGQARKSQKGEKKSLQAGPDAVSALIARKSVFSLNTSRHNRNKNKTGGQQRRKMQAAKVSQPRKRAHACSNKDGEETEADGEMLDPERKRPKPANYSGPVWVQCCVCEKWRLLGDCRDPASLPDEWECSMNTDAKASSCSSPEEHCSEPGDSQEFVESPFVPGSIVWAKMDGYPWWPAMVEEDPDKETYYDLGNDGPVPVKYHVVFLDTPVSRVWLHSAGIQLYEDEIDMNKELGLTVPRKHCRGLSLGLKMARRAIKMGMQERLQTFSFSKRFRNGCRRRHALTGRKGQQHTGTTTNLSTGGTARQDSHKSVPAICLLSGEPCNDSHSGMEIGMEAGEEEREGCDIEV